MVAALLVRERVHDVNPEVQTQSKATKQAKTLLSTQLATQSDLLFALRLSVPVLLLLFCLFVFCLFTCSLFSSDSALQVIPKQPWEQVLLR